MKAIIECFILVKLSILDAAIRTFVVWSFGGALSVRRHSASSICYLFIVSYRLVFVYRSLAARLHLSVAMFEFFLSVY